MPLEKLNAFTKKVGDLADKPVMSSAELKAHFDAAPDDVRRYLNKLIDVLQSDVVGDSGADNIKVTSIPGLPGVTVQALLEALKTVDDIDRDYLLLQIQNVVLGQVPDGSITPVKLSADAKKASNISVLDVTDLFTAIDVEGALKEAMETANSAKKLASDGKTLIANATSDKGVPASPTDTFPTLATKIGQINTGKKWASGTGLTSPFIKNGLPFRPKVIFLWTSTLIYSYNDSFDAAFTYSANGTNSAKFSTTITADGFNINEPVFRTAAWIAFE